jgi:FAD:protein FMN transferase
MGVTAKQTIFLILCFLFFLFSPGNAASQEENLFRKSRVIMGTSVEIVVSQAEEKKAEEALEAGLQEVQRIDSLMSNYRGESELSRVNRNAGEKEIKVSPDMLRVMRRALHFFLPFRRSF